MLFIGTGIGMLLMKALLSTQAHLTAACNWTLVSLYTGAQTSLKPYMQTQLLFVYT